LLAVYCPILSNSGNASWPQTFANGSVVVSGTCLTGYFGNPTRNCTQFGSNGNWSSITGSCVGKILVSKKEKK
jgi:hypothetical protein